MTPAALYVETSALLRILLERDADLLAEFSTFSELVTSALTFVEAERGLLRALRERRIGADQRREGQRWLASFARTCETVTLDDRVLERAKAELPVEPVRALDALHLATVLVWEEALGALAVASCDERVRANATALGFRVLPDHPAVKRPAAVHEKRVQPRQKATITALEERYAAERRQAFDTMLAGVDKDLAAKLPAELSDDELAERARAAVRASRKKRR